MTSRLYLNRVIAEYTTDEQETSLEKISSGQVNKTYLLKESGITKGVLRETRKPTENVSFETDLINHLYRGRLPVAKIIPTLRGDLAYRTPNSSITYQLFSYIEGIQRTEGEITEKESMLVGQVMGKIHLSLQDCIPSPKPIFPHFGRYPDLPSRFKWNDYIVKELLPDFNKETNKDPRVVQLARTIEKDLERLGTELNKSYDKLPKHPIHGDLTLENIIFDRDSSKINGIIDFDDAHIDPRIFDVVIASMYFGINDGNFSVEKIRPLYHTYMGQLDDTSPINENEIKAIAHLTETYALFVVLWTIRGFNVEPNEASLSKVLRYSTILESIKDIETKTWRDLL